MSHHVSTENSLAKSYACPCTARKMKQTPRHPHVPAPHPWPDKASPRLMGFQIYSIDFYQLGPA